MNRGIAALLVPLLLLLAACGIGQAGTGPVQETLGLDEDGVPVALLATSDGESQQALAGTRCWDGLCVDMIGLIAPQEALHVSPDEELTLQLGAGEPSTVNLRVLEWQTSEFDGPPEAVLIAFDAPVVQSGPLQKSQSQTWYAPGEPGEYMISLFTSYPQGGDISYGWHLVVDAN